MATTEAVVQPSVIEWARTSSGLSVDDAAQRIGVRPRRLIEWEEGVRLPTMPQARQAAHVYRRPLAVLFLPFPPADPAPPPDFRSGSDSAAFEGAVPQLRYHLRQAAHRQSIAAELAPNRPSPITDLAGSARTTSDPEAEGIRVRRLLGVSWSDQVTWRDNYRALNEWRDAVEQLGVLVFRFSDVPSRLARGFSISGSRYPVIAVNSTDSPAGRIFTLLHEVGHLIAATGGLCDLDELQGDRSPEAQAAEQFCNRFAAAVLMPRNEFLALPRVARAGQEADWSQSDLRELATTMSVSRHALVVRLLEVARIDRATYRSLVSQFNFEARDPGGGFELPAEGAVRQAGKNYTQIVLAAYENQEITAPDLSAYLGVRFKHLSRIRELVLAS